MKKPLSSLSSNTKNCMARLMLSSKTSRGRSVSGKDLQLPGIYLSALSRSGSRLNVPDMASSPRQSQDKLQ